MVKKIPPVCKRTHDLPVGTPLGWSTRVRDGSQPEVVAVCSRLEQYRLLEQLRILRPEREVLPLV
jgi:hypothetical protein